MTPPVRFRHRVEYAAFRAVRRVLRILPDWAALGFGEALGWVAGTLFRMRRSVVDENLLRAFPDESRRWRARVARASYRHLGRESALVFLLGRGGPEWVRRATEVEGIEHLQRGVDAGVGAVLVTGHIGSWEMGGPAFSVRGLPIDPVAQTQGNPLFDRDLTEAREAMGLKLIRRGEAGREVLRSLRRGRVPALVADQNARRAPLFVNFFGVPAATFRGPALFALRSGAPLVVGACLRVSRHPQRYRVVVEEVSVPRTDDLDHDVAVLTQAWSDVLERWVRHAPEQYFWQHKRWKTRPPQSTETQQGTSG